MIKVLIILWGSAVIGYLLRRWPFRQIGRLLLISICIMLAFIGIEVGSNRTLMQSIGQLGLTSLTAAALTALCTATGAALLWKCTRKTCNEAGSPGKPIKKTSLWKKMQGSLLILSCFICGCLIGLNGIGTFIPEHASVYTLYFLLLCVGLSIGQNRELLKSLRRTPKRLLLLPAVTVLSSFAAATAASFLFTGYNLQEWLSVGSGFGYYSLSSILITEARGAELGTVALLYNISLEIYTLVLAPVLVRIFGPLAPISTGGATTADTTLPVITQTCGDQFLPLSILHGVTVDFLVPILVPFFCSL